jgi:hypothetical protein
MDKTLVELLEDAIAMIEAAEIEDSEHWLGQARAALAEMQS